MAAIRIVNRQGAAEVLGGLVFGPLATIGVAWMWLSGEAFDGLVNPILSAIVSICLPFFVAYCAYRALFVCTLWIRFGREIRI